MEEEFQERFRRHAFSLHQHGWLQDAESAYRQILERCPGDLEVRTALGELALKIGNHRWALQLFGQVAQSHDSAELQNSMGMAFCGLSQLDDALRCYDRAIAMQTAHLPARMNRAKILGAMGRFEAAASAYARAIELGADNAETHTLRGVTLGTLGLADESLACFDRALELEPTYLPAHAHLSAQLRKLKNKAEAALAAARPVEVAQPVAAALPAEAAPLEAVEDGPVAPPQVAAPLVPDDVLVEPPAALAVADTPAVTDANVAPERRRSLWTTLIDAAPTLVSCACTALIGLEVAATAGVLLKRAPPLPEAAVDLAATTPKNHKIATLNIQPIVAAHLFGIPGEPRKREVAAIAKADLKLTGTLATEDPRSGLAIIGEQGKSRAYKIGESLDGSALWEVYKDHVVLERDGAFESLFLPRERLLGSALSQPADKQASITPEMAAWIDDVATSKPELDASGSLLGIRVVPGRNRAAFARSGLIGGDIVVAVNGTNLESGAGADWLKSVSSGSSVTVLRRGVRKDITLSGFQ